MGSASFSFVKVKPLWQYKHMLCCQTLFNPNIICSSESKTSTDTKYYRLNFQDFYKNVSKIMSKLGYFCLDSCTKNYGFNTEWDTVRQCCR